MKKNILHRGLSGGFVELNLDIDIDNYLTIQALEDGLTAKLSTNACEYCVDGNGNWKSLAAGTVTESVNAGQTLSFRGNLTPTSSKGIGTFSITKRCNLKGNCMSIIFGDNAVNASSLSGYNYAFLALFYGCNYIINVSENFLPATTLSDYCYSGMFRNCKNLVNPPKLPAKVLTEGCYGAKYNTSGYSRTKVTGGMFEGCSSLSKCPSLPATTFKSYCYCEMLSGTPVIPDCTNINFSSTSVVQSGGLIGLFCGTNITDSQLSNILPKVNNKITLPCTSLNRACYLWMFNSCSNLTIAPELPATTLANECYNSMFGFSGITTAPKLPATTLSDYCYNSMFYGCKSLKTAPDLPAVTLKTCCYQGMFNGCSKLNYIKMLATNTSATDCLRKWVNGVASTGTFIKNSAMTTLPTGESGIPSGWTVSNA